MDYYKSCRRRQDTLQIKMPIPGLSPFGFVLLLVLLASCCDDILDGMLFFSSPFPSFCKCVQIAMGSKNYVIAGQERGKAGCATCAPEQIVLGR